METEGSPRFWQLQELRVLGGSGPNIEVDTETRREPVASLSGDPKVGLARFVSGRALKTLGFLWGSFGILP